MSDFQYTFTVFTPTYNRAHLLSRPYESLVKQSFRDFEWLVVDDGSTDETPKVLDALQVEAPFPMRRIRQSNQGKCEAVNRAAVEARGRFFAFLDSDDEYLPEALERLKSGWDSIPDHEKKTFSGVSGHTQTPDGRLVGTRFPHSPTDSDSIAIRFRHGVRGEKSGFQRTDVLRRFPFDTYQGETTMPESLVYHRIALQFRTRYINDVVRVYYDTPGSWANSFVKVRAQSPQGWSQYYLELTHLPREIPQKERIKGYANYVRTSLHGGVRMTEQLQNAPSAWYWLAGVPIGVAAYLNDRRALSGKTA